MLYANRQAMNDLTRRRRRRRSRPRRKIPRPPRVGLGKRELTKKKGAFTGVCAGLGEYLGIDPVLVRIGFIAGSFFSFGTAAIVYLGLAAFLPSEESEDRWLDEHFDENEPYSSRKQKAIEGGSFFEEAQIIDDVDGSLSVCWRCDTVSKPESKFCHKCGAKL